MKCFCYQSLYKMFTIVVVEAGNFYDLMSLKLGVPFLCI